MFVKIFVRCIVFVGLAASLASASRKDEITLLILPREDDAVRIGMDFAKRYPSLLMRYQKAADGSVALHGWTGKDWVNVNIDAFREGAFFKVGPDSALVIEKEGAPVPHQLIPPSDWCPAVYKISTIETRPLLHLAGQYFDLKYKDWQWFAENYNQPLEAINPEGLNVAWYHKRFSEHFSRSGVETGSDLQYWAILRHPLPESRKPEPEAVEEAVETGAEPAESVEAAAEAGAQAQPEVQADGSMENPLEEEVKEAVVLGAGSAEESGKQAGEKKSESGEDIEEE
jgi:hypothetical protein